MLTVGVYRIGTISCGRKRYVRNMGQEKARCTFPHVIIQQSVKEGWVTVFQAIEIDIHFKTVVL